MREIDELLKKYGRRRNKKICRICKIGALKKSKKVYFTDGKTESIKEKEIRRLNDDLDKGKKIFVPILNEAEKKYRDSFKAGGSEECIPDSRARVWILVGTEKNTDGKRQKVIIEVGKNNNFDDMFNNDLKKDIGAIFGIKKDSRDKEGKKAKKYGNLLNEYDRLEFYEIDVEKYIEGTDFASFIKAPEGELEKFLPAYWQNAAYFTEASIAERFNAKRWKAYNGGMDAVYSQIIQKQKGAKK